MQTNNLTVQCTCLGLLTSKVICSSTVFRDGNGQGAFQLKCLGSRGRLGPGWVQGQGSGRDLNEATKTKSEDAKIDFHGNSPFRRQFPSLGISGNPERQCYRDLGRVLTCWLGWRWRIWVEVWTWLPAYPWERRWDTWPSLGSAHAVSSPTAAWCPVMKPKERERERKREWERERERERENEKEDL